MATFRSVETAVNEVRSNCTSKLLLKKGKKGRSSDKAPPDQAGESGDAAVASAAGCPVQGLGLLWRMRFFGTPTNFEIADVDVAGKPDQQDLHTVW